MFCFIQHVVCCVCVPFLFFSAVNFLIFLRREFGVRNERSFQCNVIRKLNIMCLLRSDTQFMATNLYSKWTSVRLECDAMNSYMKFQVVLLKNEPGNWFEIDKLPKIRLPFTVYCSYSWKFMISYLLASKMMKCFRFARSTEVTMGVKVYIYV